MSSIATRPADRPVSAGRRRLPSGVAFYLLASIVVFFLAASSAPTPLYATYQAEWGFSAITTTVVFGIYAMAVLVALLTAGSLSDHIGRRPVLIAAVLVQAAVMLVFATAQGVPELVIARIAQGLSTGAAIGAVGAGMLDLNKAKGTLANSVAPMMGTATGAIGSGLLVQYLPAPTRIVYLVLFAIFIAQAVGVALIAETSTPQPGALASLRPQIAVPSTMRGPVLLAAPALVAVWSLAGFYGALGPAIVRTVTGSSSPVLGGAALFVLAGAGAASVLLLRRSAPRTVALIGTVALLIGGGLTLLAINETSTALFFVGAAIAGVGFGGGFQGAIRTVVPLAAPHERSGVLSILYVISYLAMGLPAVIGGFLVVDGSGLLTTAREYTVAVMVLAALALIGLVLRPTRAAAAAAPVAPCRPLALASEAA